MCFEPALLKGHETGGGEEPGFVVREEVVEWRDGAAVVVKRQPLVVQVEQRSDDITGLPPNRGWIVDGYQFQFNALFIFPETIYVGKSVLCNGRNKNSWDMHCHCQLVMCVWLYKVGQYQNLTVSHKESTA